MSAFTLKVLAPVAAALALLLAGCGTQEVEPESGQSANDNHAGHEHSSGKISAQLAKLSAADRELAEKQKNCPVTDEPLGSMGVPIKVTVEGQDIFICCAGCQNSLENDPEKYLAKLPK